jgi:hypothetical protein
MFLMLRSSPARLCRFLSSLPTLLSSKSVRPKQTHHYPNRCPPHGAVAKGAPNYLSAGHGESFVSRASLVEAYISALNLTAIAIVSDGLRCRIETGEPAEGEKIKRQFFFKPSHAELVLMTIGKEGLSGKPPAVLAALIERTAAMLGAPFQTPSELQAAAEHQVAEITARIKAAGTSGALKKWNSRYRQYRIAQVEKREPAICYATFLEQFVIMPTVRSIAATGRMV